MYFSVRLFFFLCGLTHKKISFNLGEHNFSVRVRPIEKLFLTMNPQKNLIFLSLYFCRYFSEGTPSEKYFSDGIRIFLCVFADTEECEFSVVNSAKKIEKSKPQKAMSKRSVVRKKHEYEGGSCTRALTQFKLKT